VTERDPALSASAAWMHDLRNAVNAVALSVALARRHVGDADVDRAQASLGRAEQGLQRVRTLLDARDGPK